MRGRTLRAIAGLIPQSRRSRQSAWGREGEFGGKSNLTGRRRQGEVSEGMELAAAERQCGTYDKLASEAANMALPMEGPR
jgi:hypothetical protein